METPLATTEVARISGKKVAVVAVLRAGLGMLDTVIDLIPVARVGFVGLYRDEHTLQPVEYYSKLPGDMEERDVLMLDPMLATGGSAAAALTRMRPPGRSPDEPALDRGRARGARTGGTPRIPT